MRFDVNSFSLPGLAIVACALLAPGADVFAEDSVGTWKLSVQLYGSQIEQNLVVTKTVSGLKAELEGESKWGTVENFDFSDGVLKFDVASSKGQLSFSGNVNRGQLKGVFESNFGEFEFPVTGRRVAEPLPDELTGIDVGEKAPDFKLQDHTGQERALTELHKDGAVALVFFRSADW